MISVASQKRRPLVLVSVQETGAHQPQPGQESMGDAPVRSPCSLIRNPRPKPTGTLGHCREGETDWWFSIFSSDRIPKATNHFMRQEFPSCSNYTYTRELRKIFEASAKTS